MLMVTLFKTTDRRNMVRKIGNKTDSNDHNVNCHDFHENRNCNGNGSRECNKDFKCM